MFSLQHKTTRHGEKNKKVWPHTEKKKKVIRKVPVKAQTLDLLDKDFKFAILNMLKELKTLLIEVKKKSVA